MQVLAEAGLEGAVARIPHVLAETMFRGIDEPEVRIGAGAYETELAMCPVAAAVRYAEARGEGGGDWDPAWGTVTEFRRTVVDFVDCFDDSAETVGLSQTIEDLRGLLARRISADDIP